MKVLITGGTGFVGSHIVVELLRKGHEVTLLARNPKKISAFLDMPRLTLIRGSMDDIDVIRQALIGQDACIHNAIYWEEEPTELQLKDSRTSVQLFEAASDAGVGHLVYTSSTAVHRPFRLNMDEEQRLTPTDFYGATKAANEAFLSAFSAQTNMRCTTIRPGPVIGTPALEGAPVKVDRRVQAFVRAALRGDEISVVKNDGRQFIAASDLAKVYERLISQKPHHESRAPTIESQHEETYLAVATNFTTWEAIARQVVDLARSNSRVVVEDQGLSEKPNLFDVSKLGRRLGLTFDSSSEMKAHLSHLVATS